MQLKSTPRQLGSILLGLTLVGGVNSSVLADEHRRIIEVSGEAQQMVVADHYEIQVDLVVRAEKRGALQALMESKRQSLQQLLEQHSIARDDSGYTRADMQEEFKWEDNQRQRVGFSLQESWWIKVSGAEQNHALLNALGGLNAVDSFRSVPSAQGQQVYRAALTAALQDAKQKADAMVRTLGTCLGPVQSIREQQSHSPAPQPMLMKASMESMDASPEARVSSNAQVNVVWQLADCD